MQETGGRTAQKTRTREALLDAARDLMADNAQVTVASAADRAGISRATAYRYFSDPATLASEAGLAVEVLPYEQVVDGAHGTREKVRAVSLYILDLSIAHERAFRQFLARALDASVAKQGRPGFRRGARRISMFEAALEAEKDRLGEERLRELVLCLTAATGSEAMIALFDIAQVDEKTARQTVLTTADALLDRFLGPA